MAKKLAMIFGVVFVLVGLLGFVSNPIVGSSGYFMTDTLHNLVHLAVGIIMLVMAGNKATLALIIFGAVYLLLAILGFVMGGDKLLGLIMSNSADNWLHLVLGVVILGLGLMTKSKPTSMPSSGMGM